MLGLYRTADRALLLHPPWPAPDFQNSERFKTTKFGAEERPNGHGFWTHLGRLQISRIRSTSKRRNFGVEERLIGQLLERSIAKASRRI